MILRLPIPPSVNAMYRNVAGVGRVKTREYKAWLKEADACYLMQKSKLLPVTGQIIVSIKVPKRTRGDISNRIKAAEDFLVSRRLTSDDRHTFKISIERADVTECEIEVLAVAYLSQTQERNNGSRRRDRNAQAGRSANVR